MVFLNATKRFNKFLGPFLLRNGLRARFLLARGDVQDNPTLDSVLLLSWAQKLISLEVHDECEQTLQDPSWRERFSGGGTNKTESKTDADDTSPLEESALRVSVLERYLRPALVQNELWSDVQIWQFHHRLLKWARAEFLQAKYGPELRLARDGHASLGRSRQLTSPDRFGMLGKLLSSEDAEQQQPLELPNSATVVEAFQMQNWKQEKDYSALHGIMKRIAKKLSGDVLGLPGYGLCVADVPPEQSVSDLSLEEILEVAGGHVMSCGPFNALCEEIDMYQLWTSDYVERLGRYLAKRTENFSSGETIVLDIGAGDGLLARCLREYFEKSSSSSCPEPTLPAHRKRRKGHRARTRPAATQLRLRPRKHSKVPTVIATDDGSWRIPTKANVERLSLQGSLSRYADSKQEEQVIVLCSWMPMGEDWSAAFREGGVDEYILIGECDDGQCGDNWETWGNKTYHPDHVNSLSSTTDEDGVSETSLNYMEANTSLTTPPTPPYQVDGFERRDLEQLRPHQFSRFDCALSKSGATVSFRRARAAVDR